MIFLLAFLAFTLPTEINDTIRAFRPLSVSYAHGPMVLLTAVFIAMGQLNHAIHFYIYTLTGQIFRNELIRLFSLGSIDKGRSDKNDRLSGFHRSSSDVRLVVYVIHWPYFV